MLRCLPESMVVVSHSQQSTSRPNICFDSTPAVTARRPGRTSMESLRKLFCFSENHCYYGPWSIGMVRSSPAHSSIYEPRFWIGSHAFVNRKTLFEKCDQIPRKIALGEIGVRSTRLTTFSEQTHNMPIVFGPTNHSRSILRPASPEFGQNGSFGSFPSCV